MKRFDSSASSIQRDTPDMPTPLAVKVVLVALGAGIGAFALMCALEWPAWELRGRVTIGVVGGLMLLFALLIGIGELRPVAHKALMGAERMTYLDLNGDGQIGQPDVRLMPVSTNRMMKLSGSDTGIPDEDMRYMVEQLALGRGWATRDWDKSEQLPSGHSIVKASEDDNYLAFIEILKKLGALEGHKEKSKGRLTMEPDEILRRLGL